MLNNSDPAPHRGGGGGGTGNPALDLQGLLVQRLVPAAVPHSAPRRMRDGDRLVINEGVDINEVVNYDPLARGRPVALQ